MKTLLLIGFLLLGMMIIVSKVKADEQGEFGFDEDDYGDTTVGDLKLQGINLKKVREKARNLLFKRYGIVNRAREFLRCLNIKILEQCPNELLECLKTDNPKVCLESIACSGTRALECLHILPDKPDNEHHDDDDQDHSKDQTENLIGEIDIKKQLTLTFNLKFE